jgi:hypothetical protein
MPVRQLLRRRGPGDLALTATLLCVYVGARASVHALGAVRSALP